MVPSTTAEPGPVDESAEVTVEPVVPTISVRLVQSLRLPPSQYAVVQVEVEGTPQGAVNMLEPEPSLHDELGLDMPSVIFRTSEVGKAGLVVANTTGFTCQLAAGTQLGRATDATIVDGAAALELTTTDDWVVPAGATSDGQPCEVSRVDGSADDDERKRKLLEMVEISGLVSPEQRDSLRTLLSNHHRAFSINAGERGETSLVQMEVDTGDAVHKRQPVRRMPFAVRQEVANQLRDMQQSGVIRSSSGPWASPVVMVRKKDGSHRFCIDYRHLNSVTKPDLYPLPRIDDLLDQLGNSRFFSTLDLASGYWQVRVHPESVEKTAFITPQGLFQFRVMPFGLMNAPSMFQRLLHRVLMGLNPDHGPDFVVVYIDDVLVFSRTLSEHLKHLELVIAHLQEAGLKLKPTKCPFICQEVEYLGHIITPSGLKPTSRLVAAVAEFPVPRNVREVRQFLGLSSYYRRFIPEFARIAKPLHELTRKSVQFIWDGKCQAAFATLTDKLTQAPVLAYPCFNKPFVLETDASAQGIGAVLSQPQEDGHLHPIAYASRALSPTESKYAITELETLAVVWAMSHFHSFLYGHSVTVYTDHSAVRAILNSPNPSGRHARWWTKVYGRGVREVKIQYRPGKLNASADALSRSPQEPAPETGLVDDEAQVAVIGGGGDTTMDIGDLLRSDPVATKQTSFETEQRKDTKVMEVINFLENGDLPDDEKQARKLALQEHTYVMIDGVLYHLDSKREHHKQVVVPQHLQKTIMEETHRGPMSGHFSGQRLFNTLRRRWWWGSMYNDAQQFAKACPECVVVAGGGRVLRPELHPIPVSQPFQIIGVDVIDLPLTTRGNKHVLVFQDLFSKWPMVYAMPDQKSERIVRILVDEIFPFCGVPEALLSDRGTNLLSHLMKETCELLGVRKLNTTAYHPQCDGLVERYNRTLKTALRKHAARFGVQWDQLLPGIVWAYRNTPHESTHEKPSYLLFGFDCRTPTEAALLPPTEIEPTNVEKYREELITSLSSARELAAQSIRQAQKRYKGNYDKKAIHKDYRIGEWVLVKFPADETGRMRKLARAWHGPYRVLRTNEPDITVEKVYRSQDGTIQVHKTRVTPCPDTFPAGYHWYGDRRQSPGRPPRWVDQLLRDTEQENVSRHDEAPDTATSDPTPRGECVPASSEASCAHDIEREDRPSNRYRLRWQVVPPDRLVKTSSGRA